MIRRITFDDQVSLVAKLRVPLVYAIAFGHRAASVASITNVEVAGENFLG